MGACGKARIRPASLSLLLFVSLLVADRPTASAGNGGSPANVAATGLAAHFSSHSSRLQLISIPGQWNGFNSSAVYWLASTIPASPTHNILRAKKRQSQYKDAAVLFFDALRVRVLL
mmetsp:Transcript_30403/g.54447  ORF Transcript_30403/g.54447 Transcript_30403/m.54447 type:complete len:117 (-) Transcript_30403:163-513(-)